MWPMLVGLPVALVLRSIFDYVDAGAEDEVTKADNEQAFRTLSFRPRAGVSVEQPNLGTTVLGTPISMPVLLAPCGLVQLMHRDGALGIARAARKAGTISALSTFAGVPPEVLESEPGPRWFQLYATDRESASDLIERGQEKQVRCPGGHHGQSDGRQARP